MKMWRRPFDHAEKATKPGRVHILKERCKGCGFCTEFCPTGALKMSQELSPQGYYLAEVDDETKCLSCGLCETICPDFAIHLDTSDKED